jgi:hypothetical protein
MSILAMPVSWHGNFRSRSLVSAELFIASVLSKIMGRENMALPDEVKENLKEVLSAWLENFEPIAEAERDFLARIGIEPKRETMVSYTAGVVDTVVGSYIHTLFNRGMTDDEDAEMIAIFKEKLPELERKLDEFLSKD